MYLVFDTETTGLPISWRAPVSDVGNWPRVVQLAWEAFDARGRRTGARSFVIRPDGFKIPKDAERIHGISTLRAKRTGIAISEALGELKEALGRARVVVAHNFSFDGNVVGAEFYRLGIGDQFRSKVQVCTKESATDFCALPGRYGFKWPTLTELHLKLFGKKVKERHDAVSDVATCATCFFELKRLGVVRITKR